LASVAICLVVIASFALFVVNQAGEASTHQLRELGAPAGAAHAKGKQEAKPKATVRTRIDELANDLTSPFKGVTSGSSSQWTIHGVNLLLTLIVYGFGLGFLARVLRMR
jgi:hypothetical protein